MAFSRMPPTLRGANIEASSRRVILSVTMGLSIEGVECSYLIDAAPSRRALAHSRTGAGDFAFAILRARAASRRSPLWPRRR